MNSHVIYNFFLFLFHSLSFLLLARCCVLETIAFWYVLFLWFHPFLVNILRSSAATIFHFSEFDYLKWWVFVFPPSFSMQTFSACCSFFRFKLSLFSSMRQFHFILFLEAICLFENFLHLANLMVIMIHWGIIDKVYISNLLFGWSMFTTRD